MERKPRLHTMSFSCQKVIPMVFEVCFFFFLSVILGGCKCIFQVSPIIFGVVHAVCPSLSTVLVNDVM